MKICVISGLIRIDHYFLLVDDCLRHINSFINHESYKLVGCHAKHISPLKSPGAEEGEYIIPIVFANKGEVPVEIVTVKDITPTRGFKTPNQLQQYLGKYLRFWSTTTDILERKKPSNLPLKPFTALSLIDTIIRSRT